MATYNFTVRATDNLGAFADQNFSLTVNNTNIERFVIAGLFGLVHSSDGVTWTAEAGQFGGKVVFGNGKWVVYAGPNPNVGLGMSIRTSTDAFNWTTVTPTFPNGQGTNANLYAYVPSVILSMKYQNGYWTAICASASYGANPNYYSAMIEYTSPDLVTWTRVSALQAGPYSGPTTVNVYDHYLDAGGNLVLSWWTQSSLSTISYRPSGSITYTPYVSGITPQIAGSITYTSGLYSVAMGGNSNVYTSIDGIGWTARAVPGFTYATGFTYANGRLITRSSTTSSVSSAPTAYSLNGGRTWVAGGTAAFTAGPGGVSAAQTQDLAYYGGRVVMLEGGTNGYICTSTDSGATWTEST
ncbi:MAG: hypothetical protein EOO77_36340, partial [Oxalobacteraceae bacterium]